MTTGRLPEDAPDPRFDYALGALQAGAWADAARLFEQYVGTHPDSAPAWGNLSLAYRGLGDTPRQLAAARRATELDPSAQSSLLVLGEALLASGLYAEALVHSQSALGRFPNDIAFLEVAAKAHDGLDQPEKAIKTARRAIRYSLWGGNTPSVSGALTR
jgi:tetratricopeptide (TPR) repeat protein